MGILRVGCYERVSTEEQAVHGYSIAAQVDNLTEYCQKNNMKVVDHYTDEGKSGSLPPLKRPNLARLLADVKAGKIDMVLFTKLDRWFRSVKEYFKVQEILDEHKVEWKAIHEDYDTTTANGRMAITIFLAIAQNERERTAERIRVVFEHKRKNKEACFGGNAVPFGYKKEIVDGVMRLVKDPETREAVEGYWDILKKYGNHNMACRFVNNCGFNRPATNVRRMMNSEFYCGMYRGIEDYCEPYISREDWLRIQEARPIKQTKHNKVYLFTGLMKCPVCGFALSSTSSAKRYKGVQTVYKSYRCRHKFSDSCDWRRAVSEKKIEKYLLSNITRLIEEEIAHVDLERSKPKPKPKTNIPALKERLRRLNIMYMAGNMSDEDYLKEEAEIKAIIQKAEKEISPEEKRDIEPLRQLLETNFLSTYHDLEDIDKQRFWREIIREIKLEGNAPNKVIFF